jgi:hypothetical protein
VRREPRAERDHRVDTERRLGDEHLMRDDLAEGMRDTIVSGPAR